MSNVDPTRFMEVVERHASSVTFALLCDLLPVLNLRLIVKTDTEEANLTSNEKERATNA